MKNNKCCRVHGCDSQDFSQLCFNGEVLCNSHYTERFLKELSTLFNDWKVGSEPDDRLKYLIGRYYSEHEVALIGKPSLTKAIVHERSYEWKKIEDAAVFTVIRFPVKRKYGENLSFDEMHQTWEFNIEKLKFTFLSEKIAA
jgi:hypothetical protein